MPYDRNDDLPKSVKDKLPAYAQDIYRSAYNSAWDQYDQPAERRGNNKREETAHQVAWAAVKKKYTKSGDRWVAKKD